MVTKLSAITVLASLMLIGSIVTAQSLPPATLSSDGKVSITMPEIKPTTRTAETDAADIADARTAVGNARNDAAAAHTQLTRAKRELDEISSKLQRELQTNSDLCEATKAVDAATADYERLTAPVLAELAQRADYRAASADLARATQRAAEVSRAGGDPQERVQAAQAVLAAKTVLAKLKQDALSTNSDIMNAKARCVQAVQHRSLLRSQLEQAIRQNPNYLAALQAVADAREVAAGADQQLAAANEKLAATGNQAADREAARQKFNDFLYSHGVTATPPQ
jgi:hypothetical protein